MEKENIAHLEKMLNRDKGWSVFLSFFGGRGVDGRDGRRNGNDSVYSDEGQWSGPFISALAPGRWFPSTTFLLTSGPPTHHYCQSTPPLHIQPTILH